MVSKFARTVSFVNRLIMTGRKLELLADPTPQRRVDDAKAQTLQSLSTARPLSQEMSVWPWAIRCAAQCFCARVKNRLVATSRGSQKSAHVPIERPWLLRLGRGIASPVFYTQLMFFI